MPAIPTRSGKLLLESRTKLLGYSLIKIALRKIFSLISKLQSFYAHVNAPIYEDDCAVNLKAEILLI
jgi:hypothetical protein